jgi:hypothetical protein
MIFSQYYSNLLRSDVHQAIRKETTQKTVKDRPTAWQRFSTYGKFDEGDIGNSWLGNY